MIIILIPSWVINFYTDLEFKVEFIMLYKNFNINNIFSTKFIFIFKHTEDYILIKLISKLWVKPKFQIENIYKYY